MSTEKKSYVNGLVFFNSDGTSGGYIRPGDAEYVVNGSWSNDGRVIVRSAGVELEYEKVPKRTERGPIARGRLTITDTGEQYPVSVFRVTLEDGTIAHGLADGWSGAENRIDAPF